MTKWTLVAAVVGGVVLAAVRLHPGFGEVPIGPPPPAVERAVVRPADLVFDMALGRAVQLPRLKSLLVSVDGHLAAEYYFNGAAATRPTNLKSASKSVIGILVGIAIERGDIASLRTPIASYFPRELAGDPSKASITIENLLTMRSGLETTSNRNYGPWVVSRNWVQHVLAQPLVAEPGGPMIYSTGTSHLLSAILTKATGRSTYAFARDELAEPLGIALQPWLRDPQGIYFGGNEMMMTSRDMLAIGELYLNDGLHDGRQIVSEAWVRESTLARTRSPRSRRQYGYAWWIRTMADHPVFYAWGYGGQFIFVVPDLRTVVVTTSVSDPGSERRGHLQAVYDLVERDVIPVAALAEVAALQVDHDASTQTPAGVAATATPIDARRTESRN